MFIKIVFIHMKVDLVQYSWQGFLSSMFIIAMRYGVRRRV